MKIAGIDEAGKGPVIGPLVVGIFCCSKKSIDRLKKIGVKDSKKLSPKKRTELFKKLKEIGEYDTIKIDARSLDELMKKRTINEILKDCYAKLINKVSANVYIVDSPDVIPERISNELSELSGKNVKALHKADERCDVVAAASIIAKVERDLEIEKIKEILGDFGSGYASDERTIRFLKNYLKKHGKLPPHTRLSWKTVSNLMQKRLEDFI